MPTNQFNQPIGKNLPNFKEGELPTSACLMGDFAKLKNSQKINI